MLEHTNYLGPTLARIAWHKAGIMKPMSYAYSVPQASEVLDVLQAEAEALGAEFAWIAPMDMGQYIATDADGVRFRLGRYGEVKVSLLGRYQVENATLAVQGAGNMHGRLPGIPHGSSAYVEAIRAGLADVTWAGRLQKLQDQPAVYLDGAINAESARLLLTSLRGRMTDPIIAIVGVPDDNDYLGVYRELGMAAETLILTETKRNVTLHFPDPDDAIAAARRINNDSHFAPTLQAAVELAMQRAGRNGTIIIAGTQSIVADAVSLWGLSYETI
jgi:dihydrofolate synthase/folylpolyglutamate synthase